MGLITYVSFLVKDLIDLNILWLDLALIGEV